jgi:hypothetical protein
MLLPPKIKLEILNMPSKEKNEKQILKTGSHKFIGKFIKKN